MKAKLAACLAALLLIPAAGIARDVVMTPDQVHYGEGPTLIDANKALQVKTIRMRLPAHKVLQPHGPEGGYFIATILEGSIELGFGEQLDESALHTLPEGSVFTHSPDQKHFARTGDEPVVLQVTLVGPTGIKTNSKH